MVFSPTVNKQPRGRPMGLELVRQPQPRDWIGKSARSPARCRNLQRRRDHLAGRPTWFHAVFQHCLTLGSLEGSVNEYETDDQSETFDILLICNPLCSLLLHFGFLQ